MAAITTHDDAPDNEEHADGEQQMNPAGSVKRESADAPDDNQRNAYENAEIHELTGCAMAFKLPM
jgi:hypothetical protein